MLDGAINTKIIVQYCGRDNAASACASLGLGGFRDWYLPSQNELRLMYDERMKIGSFAVGDYCSSSEYLSSNKHHKRPNDCWVIQFGREGKLIHYHKKSFYNVRAIRKF